MKNLINRFIQYPFYANLIIAILLIAGGLSAYNMKMSSFPERKSREITVTVVYPGASPKEMEEGITVRIEEAIRGIVGIKEINSTSSENFSRVDIETTGEYDLDETLMEVKNAVDGISSFPTAAEKPIVFKRRSTSPAVFLGLAGDVDLLTLKKYADRIEDDFLASGVVTQVHISGYPALELSIEITEEDRLRYELSFDEIAHAVMQNNQDISAGMIKSEDEEILIRSRKRSVDPNQIGNIILRAKDDGSYIRIRDVATVKLQFSDEPSGYFMNQKQALFIAIRKLVEEDLQEISEYMLQYVEEFNRQHPEVHLYITWDFFDLLMSRLNLLISNGLIGLLLVLTALGFFLNFRLSLWVAWGIPASFLAMFVIANLYGITINMISLFGMILVIGILVDDGIVIGENIYTHFEQGKSPKRAALDGTMEVMPAVVTSITTTIIAFSPLLLTQGRMEFLFEMAFVVIFSLAFSLMEAFFVLPAHLANRYVLRKKERSHRIRIFLEKMINYLRYRIYGRLLRFCIRWKWAVVTIPFALFFITLGFFRGGFIKSTFFPYIPPDWVNVDIAFTPGSGQKQTLNHLARFDSIFWEVDKKLQQKHNDTSSYINFTFMWLGQAFNGLETGAHAGGGQAMLKNMENREVSSDQITRLVRQEIGEVTGAIKLTVGASNRWGSPISISLLSKNLKELDSAKLYLMNEVKKIPDLSNVTDNNAQGKREVRLHLKPKAFFLGLNHATIATQIRQGFFGGQAQRLQHGKDELRVWVRYPKNDRKNIGQLEDMKIKTPKGEYPLSELATYSIQRGPVNIKRYNAQREVRVNADLEDPYQPVPPLLDKIKQEIIPKLKEKFPSIKVLYQGQQKHSTEATGDIKRYFGIAFAIMFLIIIIHFKSLWQAFIIVLMIPLAWMGAVWGHWLENFPVSILSTWGMVALSGVIINDAVVFLAKYNTNLTDGQSVVEAAYQAGIARFRAICLTTITTTAGLYPIILEQSRQAQFLIPMAISLAYGVMIGTAFILVFFPVFIIILNDFKIWLSYLWTGNKPEREVVEPAIIYKNKTGINLKSDRK